MVQYDFNLPAALLGIPQRRDCKTSSKRDFLRGYFTRRHFHVHLGRKLAAVFCSGWVILFSTLWKLFNKICRGTAQLNVTTTRQTNITSGSIWNKKKLEKETSALIKMVK